MSAAASLGLSLLWDTDVGLSHVDKYTYSSEEHIKVSSQFPKVVEDTFSVIIRRERFLQQAS